MDKPLRILHWNARGLKRKVALLRPLLQEQDIDVALISETHLGPADKIKIPGFLVYRKDEQSAQHHISYRGLAVIVRRRVVHQELPIPSINSFYALGVQLFVAGDHLRVYAAYKPPYNKLQVADVHALIDAPLPTIIAGDLNCKHPAWNSNVTNTEGSRLFADAEARGYDVSGPEMPTHYPDRTNCQPDVLDIVVHNALRCQIAQQVLDDELLSDHQPVLVVLTADATRLARPAPRPNIDWEKFTRRMEATTPTRPVTTAADVDELTDDVTACIQGALKSATTATQARQRFPTLPTRIARMIAEKRRLRRQWQTNRCPTLKTQLNRLAEKVKAELQAHTAESWVNYIEAADDDWTAVHKLCRRLKNTPAPVRPLLNSDGALRYTAADRADIFATHLERQFSPNPTSDPDHSAAVEQRLREYFATPIAPEEDPAYTTPGQVRGIIRKLKTKKAPGADGITNTALRHLPPRAMATLARLFTGILRTGTFPSAWKEGRVIMIPKPGKNLRRPEGYRPITLLPTTSKVFETLLLQLLTPHLTPRPEQFGFRSEHSTTLQLSRVIHILTAAVNKREYAAAVFLDMEKAFDRVWHDGLLFKLTTTTTPRRLIRVVSSFLSDRTFRVAVEDALSSAHPITAGVPQGSCLSPALYSRYTDDIPATHSATLALYADDAAYITTSLNGEHAALKMQRALDDLPDWLRKWKLSVNVDKTQAMIVTTRARHLPPKLRLLDADIEWTRSAKYLGVTLDRRLTMGPHVRSTVARVRATRYQLRAVLSSRLPLRVKLGVYKTYIRPQLTYAAPAWLALTCANHRRSLQTQQNLTLRTITAAPRHVRNAVISRDLRVESIEDFAAQLAKKMFARADVSAWPHIQDLAPWHARPPDAKRFPRDLAADDDAQPTGLDPE